MTTLRIKIDSGSLAECTWCKGPIRKHMFIHWCYPNHLYCWHCLEERRKCRKCKNRYVKIKKFPKNMGE